MSIEVMNEAWELEKKANPGTAYNSWCRGYEAGRKAIAEAEKQELVCVCGCVWEGQELVSSPPQRQWVGLTDEEMRTLKQKSIDDGMTRIVSDFEYIRAIETKLREKNGC